ncbi:MAG: rRNA pseudouridine synthase [Alphaproteobacteria bacterium]|nr:rRNA pseudouridine synthase [Alphaproteobacteria bacterium]MBT7943310.1 rRNA pseudouridine synthase [Alphaproteobacteria bacterium]
MSEKPDKTSKEEPKGERIAKVMARAGLCSRREAERWIVEGRVRVDGKILTSPALTVTPDNTVVVDGKPLPGKAQTRLWRYHKPPGLVTSHSDPQGRATVFERIPKSLGRVISVGRLDLNSEGLLLLTNDGELARRLELPETGWTRRYRVRVHGHVNEAKLEELGGGVTVSGEVYGPIKAVLDKQQGANAWLTVSLQEGRNREIRKVMEHLGLDVNRLIRVAYGAFQLGQLQRGGTDEVTGKVLREQLSGAGGAAPRQQGKKADGSAKSQQGWARNKASKTTAKGSGKKARGKKVVSKSGKKP